jgi:hypothetical protein
MTTFERVKRNILKDMNGSITHTAASWANIMLTNNARLTDVEEQKKFWAWIQNPEDDERPDPICETFAKHTLVDIPKIITVQTDVDDEKSSVTLKQECFVNGLTTYIKVTPVSLD